MSLYYSLCPKVQFISSENSLYPYIIVYVQKYSLCLQGNVYVLRVQFISQKYSLCPQSAVYVLRVQFMSQEYSLFPPRTVYVLI